MTRNEPSSNAVLRYVGKYRTIDSRVLENSYYKSEGNTYMVIALPNERKVLRLKKSDEKNGDKPAEDGGLSRVELALNFHKYTMSKLMEPFAKEPEIVVCNVDDLEEHLKKFEPHRPDSRRHKSVIENFGTILPDYTVLPSELLEIIPNRSHSPTYCLEIKPKEPQDLPSPFDACSYCNPCPGPSSLAPRIYCPGCLFSGQRFRTSVSIATVIETRSKRCKIFKNGHLVRDGKTDVSESSADLFDDSSSLDESLTIGDVVDIVTDALLREFSRGGSHEYDKLQEEQRLNGSYSLARGGELPKGSVLETINRFQNLFRADVQKIYLQYTDKLSTLNDQTVYSLKEFDDENSTELIPLKHYLIYRIIRDCSILVTFQQIHEPTKLPPPRYVLKSGDRHFVFNVAVTDLDPKSIRCIEKHYRKSR